jgi:general secretion pathway protein K
LTPRLIEPPHLRWGERGVALLLVLWVLALVAALVLAFVGNADVALRVARNDDATAHARLLAESGVTLAILALTDQGATRWRADGTPHQVSDNGGTIEISAEDENGKIDLNVAPPELFIGLFRTLGASDAGATAAATAIINWRSGKGDAPAADSDANTPAPVPRQFFDVSEVAQIAGIGRDLYRQAAPFLTVYSFSPYINPLTAPAEVLRSLPGANEASIEAFLANRAAALADPATAPQLPGIGDVAVAPVTIVTITAHAESGSGARFTREAVVSLAPAPGAPFTILAWGQPHAIAPTPGGP